MRFNTLVDKVSKCNVLQTAIETILTTDRDDLLNLACPQWSQNLLNHPLYRKYVDHQISFLPERPFQYIKLQQIDRSDHMFKVLVLGFFTLYKLEKEVGKSTFFLNAKECPPLDEIGKLLALDTNCELSTNGKFYVDSCGYVSCRYCPEKAVEYNMPVDSKNPWWCVAKTKIFNGESVKSVFRHTIERDFQRSTFVGLLTIKIRGRQFFGDHFDKIKLTGNIEHMILFKEQALDPKCDLSEAFFSDRRIFTNGILEANPSPTHTTTDSTTAAPTIAPRATIGSVSHFHPHASSSGGETVQFRLVPSEKFNFTPTVVASALNNATTTPTNNNPLATHTTIHTTPATTSASPPATTTTIDADMEEDTLDIIVDCIPEDYKPDNDEDGHEFEVVDAKRFKLGN